MEKKPILFEAACIFSMAGSGTGFLGMLLATIFFQPVVEKITQLTNITATEHISALYFASLMAAFCVSLVGSIELFRGKRVGLFFYLMAQLVIIILPVLWLDSNAFSYTNAIFTSLFSGVYLFYFRLLS